jgi:hypothetical protein
MADNPALAIDGEHFDLNLCRHYAAGKVQGVLAYRVAEGDPGSAGHGQCLLTGIGFADRLLQRLIGADRCCPFGQLRQVNA